MEEAVWSSDGSIRTEGEEYFLTIFITTSAQLLSFRRTFCPRKPWDGIAIFFRKRCLFTQNRFNKLGRCRLPAQIERYIRWFVEDAPHTIHVICLLLAILLHYNRSFCYFCTNKLLFSTVFHARMYIPLDAYNNVPNIISSLQDVHYCAHTIPSPLVSNILLYYN